jgi:hypothetical protein
MKNLSNGFAGRHLTGEFVLLKPQALCGLLELYKQRIRGHRETGNFIDVNQILNLE